MHLSHLLCLRWCCPRKPPPADSRLPECSRPSRNLGTSQQEHSLIARTQDDSSSAYQLNYTSVTPEHPKTTRTSDPLDSVAPLLTHRVGSPSFNPSAHRSLLTVPQQSQIPAAASRASSLAQQQTDGSPGIHYSTQNIYESRNISVEGNMNHITYNYTGTVVNDSNDFMEKLLEKTIPGAAFDSSARDPPPRCHPGTRLAILQRCIDFVVNCTGERKMRWVVGAAGVGKSAIMQSVAEYPLDSVLLRASIFFFVNGRSDGSKALVTLAYQLAAQYGPYRQFIEDEIAHDPSLCQKSMSVPFQKFIVQPFIHHPQLNAIGRVLIIIDGLDECDKSHTQGDLLQLVSDFCLTSPSSPVVWIIASRPEPHLTSFFAKNNIEPAYEKEEIPVDSNEARSDVEKFLRVELTKIQSEFSLNTRGKWPSVKDFWRLADASGGLFVYAHTVIKYIGDTGIGDPTLQLDDVLQVIDALPLANAAHEDHPMTLLDALYARILSKVPTKVMKNTRKLLLALIESQESVRRGKTNFIVLCNYLGMTCDEAYAALRHLRSVLDVPPRDKAYKEDLRYFHKSFSDYISDFSRSGFSHDIVREAREVHTQHTSRILEQAPDGIDVGNLNYEVSLMGDIGTLVRGPGTGENISLTWPADEESDWDDKRTRLFMYKMAIASIADGIYRNEQAFCTVFYIRLLTTCLQSFSQRGVPNLHEVVFDGARRQDFLEQGLIQQIPVKMLNFSDIAFYIQSNFRRPATPGLSLPDPWNSFCGHRRDGEWGEGKDQAWSTHLVVPNYAFPRCDFCRVRLGKQLESCKTRSPDYPVDVLFTSTGEGLVEFKFIDHEDGVSQWTYWFRHKFSAQECPKLGITV